MVAVAVVVEEAVEVVESEAAKAAMAWTAGAGSPAGLGAKVVMTADTRAA